MTLQTLTIDDVAARHAHHPVTVRLALSDLSLHGTQPLEGGPWSILEGCADAWAVGNKCPHYTEVVSQRRSSGNPWQHFGNTRRKSDQNETN